MEKQILTENIKQLADSNGIDALGFAEASEFTGYTVKHSKRSDPHLSLPDANTIIVAGIYIGGLTLPAWKDRQYGRSSRLFLSGFFLDVVKPLEAIAALLQQQGYKTQICAGSSATQSILPLKLAAVRAGLGWQGKHSLLISKKYGTFLALGGIVTNAELEYNRTEERNRCVHCDKCQHACPLNALEQAYVLDRQKCLSFLLQDDHIPEKARTVMENRVIDCEICQDACPWNAKHLENPLPTAMTTAFQTKIQEWEKLFSFSNLATLTEHTFQETLGSLNTMIPYNIFHRNVMLAME